MTEKLYDSEVPTNIDARTALPDWIEDLRGVNRVTFYSQRDEGDNVYTLQYRGETYQLEETPQGAETEIAKILSGDPKNLETAVEEAGYELELRRNRSVIIR